ncbi:MAG: hypothetical protein DYH13_08070 [Alphaproteobacteria bacterium PRO2]|nr:hypothetical protein [Alphaproteobacteria bacterium PRO2]
MMCVASAPATAQGLWIFGKKKTEKSASQQNSEQNTNIFNKPATKKVKDRPGQSLMNKLFGPGEKKKDDPDVVINGVKFKGLKKSMLSSSYIPKSPEEIMLVAFAHKSWEGDIMAAKAADARKRIEAARLKSDAALEKMRKEADKIMAGAAEANAKAQAAEKKGQKPAASNAALPAEKQIFNKPGDKKPSKVFKDYQ